MNNASLIHRVHRGATASERERTRQMEILKAIKRYSAEQTNKSIQRSNCLSHSSIMHRIIIVIDNIAEHWRCIRCNNDEMGVGAQPTSSSSLSSSWRWCVYVIMPSGEQCTRWILLWSCMSTRFKQNNNTENHPCKFDSLASKKYCRH